MRLACAPCVVLTSSLLRRPSVRSSSLQAREHGGGGSAGPSHAPEFLVVDATPLLYAGHFAFEARPFEERLRTSNGVETSVVYSVLRSLLSLLRRSPSHLCVVFDPPGEGLGADGAPPPGWTAPWRPSSSTLLPSSGTDSAHHRTWRHHLFPEYKAQRQPSPQAVIDALPMVQRLLDACALPWLCVAGVEADDVIATLAARGAQAGLHTCVASMDKDFQQLLSPGLTLLRPGRRGQGDAEAPASSTLYTAFTHQDFLEKYGGLEPKRFPELQARGWKRRVLTARGAEVFHVSTGTGGRRQRQHPRRGRHRRQNCAQAAAAAQQPRRAVCKRADGGAPSRAQVPRARRRGAQCAAVAAAGGAAG